MFEIRKASERGISNNNWLSSKHTFSFNLYFDKKYNGFGALKVINEDRVEPNCGFAMHSHNNMEIISYVLSGALEHKDSLGNGSIIVPGDVQIMSAGSGISHSEYNPLDDRLAHFLQIWITPKMYNTTPYYQQQNFSQARKPGSLTLLASNDGRHGSLVIKQDLDFYVLDLTKNQTFIYQPKPHSKVWLQVVAGNVKINEVTLGQGDGLSVLETKELKIESCELSEILIFDLGIQC